MFSKKTVTAAALALATIAGASLTTTTAAEAGPYWKKHYGWGVAGGVLGGIALGAALAHRPAYAYPVYDGGYGPRRECGLVERVNRWGEVVVRRVCRTFY